MPAQRTALLWLIAALTFMSADCAFAQKMFNRGPSPDAGRPIGPSGGGGGFRGGGSGGPGWGAVVPGIIMTAPQGYPSNGPIIDDGPSGPRRSQQTNRRGASGAPPANERQLVPDEVVIELSNSDQYATSRRAATAVQPDAHRKPDIPVIQYNAVSLAHSGPPFGRYGCARTRR